MCSSLPVLWPSSSGSQEGERLLLHSSLSLCGVCLPVRMTLFTNPLCGQDWGSAWLSGDLQGFLNKQVSLVCVCNSVHWQLIIRCAYRKAVLLLSAPFFSRINLLVLGTLKIPLCGLFSLTECSPTTRLVCYSLRHSSIYPPLCYLSLPSPLVSS